MLNMAKIWAVGLSEVLIKPINTLDMNSSSAPRAGSAHLRKAFSLVEAAIVLGVIGLVIGGVWAAYAANREKMDVDNTYNAIQTLTNNLRNLPEHFYLTDQELINWATGQGPALNMGIIPAEFVRDGRFKNVWMNKGDDVFMGLEYHADARAFVLFMAGRSFTPKRCSQLLPRLAYNMKLGGSASPSGHSWNWLRSMEELQAACSGEHNGGGVSLSINIPVLAKE